MVKIKKPQIKPELSVISDPARLLDIINDGADDIEDLFIQGCVFNKADFSRLYFSGIIFEKCRFIECRFDKCNFTHFSVKNCDFSASIFNSCYFSQGELIYSKGAGSQLSGCEINHTVFEELSLPYLDANDCIFSNLLLKSCDFNEAYITASKQKLIKLDNNRFIKTNFVNTPLEGMDFTSSTLEGICVSEGCTELRGAIVDMYQAADLAKLIGILVK